MPSIDRPKRCNCLTESQIQTIVQNEFDNMRANLFDYIDDQIQAAETIVDGDRKLRDDLRTGLEELLDKLDP